MQWQDNKSYQETTIDSEAVERMDSVQYAGMQMHDFFAKNQFFVFWFPPPVWYFIIVAIIVDQWSPLWKNSVLPWRYAQCSDFPLLSFQGSVVNIRR